MEQHSQKQIVTNASMAANVTSPAIALNEYYGYAIQADYATSGTLGGTFTVETSLSHREDDQGNVTVAGTWNANPDLSVTISGAGISTWDVTSTSVSYARVVYTKAVSDTGTLNIYVDKKAN